MKKILVVVALILLLTVVLASCGMVSHWTHEHTWQYHLMKQPTCIEVGLMEALCLECGEKEYMEINTAAHTYIGGFCSDCGAKASSKNALERISLPAGADSSNVWSMYKLFETACEFKFKGSYEKFVMSLSGVHLKEAYLDAVGLFHVTVSTPLADGGRFTAPVALTVGRIDVENPKASVGTLLRADIVEGELQLTYTDGTSRSAGCFHAVGLAEKIVGFGISKNSELLVYYSDSTVAFAGSIRK